MYKRKLDRKKLDENERQSIIRKVFDYFRDLARSIADRLQQMLRLGQGGFAGAEAGGFVALGRLDIGIDFLYKLFHDDWEL